jgi:hypothetical protein
VAPRVRGLVLERSVLAGAARLHLVALRKTNAAARPDAGLADPLQRSPHGEERQGVDMALLAEAELPA